MPYRCHNVCSSALLCNPSVETYTTREKTFRYHVKRNCFRRRNQRLYIAGRILERRRAFSIPFYILKRHQYAYTVTQGTLLYWTVMALVVDVCVTKDPLRYIS